MGGYPTTYKDIFNEAIGNVIATGLWEWCDLGECNPTFAINAKRLLFGISFAGVIAIIAVFFLIAKKREMEWKKLDNEVRKFFKSGEEWGEEGNLMKKEN
ncbi:Uncharacterised protein [uncultured archaeon]|nr:Uncharacterised protein [uncultured archaeon]